MIRKTISYEMKRLNLNGRSEVDTTIKKEIYWLLVIPIYINRTVIRQNLY